VLEAEGAAVVAINIGDRPQLLDVDVSATGFADGTRLSDRLASGTQATVDGGRLKMTLLPASSAVFTP
jgi:hypothetical protein